MLPDRWLPRLRRALGTAFLCLLGIAPSAVAQDVTGVAAAYFESYEFLNPSILGIERVSLTSVPIGARVPVIDRVSLELRSAFAYGSMSRTDGTEVSLSGLTDSEVRANVELLRDVLTITAVGLLPTGESTQTLDQAELSGLIAADLLPFRVSNWGSGGGAGLVSTLTLPLGDFGFGLSAGYTMGQEFEPLAEDELSYRPGDEIRVRMVIDRNFGASSKASLILGGQVYQDDELSGASVYQPGDRFEALARFAFRAGAQSTGVAYGGYQRREEGRLLDAELETPAHDLYSAGFAFRIPRGTTTFIPTADLRVFRRSDGVAQGHLTSVGASVEWPAGPVTLLPTLRGRFGEALLWDGAESSVRGAEIGLGIRYPTR